MYTGIEQNIVTVFKVFRFKHDLDTYILPSMNSSAIMYSFLIMYGRGAAGDLAYKLDISEFSSASNLLE